MHKVKFKTEKPPEIESKKHTITLSQKEKELEYVDEKHEIAHGVVDKHMELRRNRTVSLVVGFIDTEPQSVAQSTTLASITEHEKWTRRRRTSHDAMQTKGKKFLINVEETKKQLLAQEDTDNDFQITIHDGGPKTFGLGSANSAGYRKYEIRGAYMLSNLLQELALAEQYGRQFIVIDEERLNENPVDRLIRLIKYHFWDGLTRRIDADGLEIIADDPKNRNKDQQARIYVPFHDSFAYEYFKEVSRTRPHLNLDVVRLPEHITPRYVKSLNSHPGILSLALRKIFDPATGAMSIKGAPFVVPGGRFNEMYGWDSYFEAVGLLVDGRIELARGMVDNFYYQIEHYGKILNANRSYYLTRSQPPFLTDMILQVSKAIRKKIFDAPFSTTGKMPSYSITDEEHHRQWLAQGVRASIKELLGVWMTAPRYDLATGLSTFHPEGIGMPIETESTHFDHILSPFAKKHNVDLDSFKTMYLNDEVTEPELDEYFVHDRAVRESGHDTTYRFEGKCANLATIDLNSLVYRYESDIAKMIEDDFGGKFSVTVRNGPNDEYWHSFQKFIDNLERDGIDALIGQGGQWDSSWAKGIMVYDDEMDKRLDTARRISPEEDSIVPKYQENAEGSSFTVVFNNHFFARMAERMKQLVNKYLWNEEKSMFYDYDIKNKEMTVYDSVTTTWALWAGLCSQEQAAAMVPKVLELFEVTGGLVSGTEDSRGRIGIDRPNRQWDYPYGWSPHQILTWRGFFNYGYEDEARRIAYRWLYTITSSFVDFNGVIPEKFDVVHMTHKVNVEYGNVGADFKMVVREGFGWMNASFQIGLKYFTPKMKKALGALIHPNELFKRKN